MKNNLESNSNTNDTKLLQNEKDIKIIFNSNCKEKDNMGKVGF